MINKHRAHVAHAALQQCNSAEKASTSERYTLPPTPTRRSRCYPQLLCTRLAAPSQMKTKQKNKKKEKYQLQHRQQQHVAAAPVVVYN